MKINGRARHTYSYRTANRAISFIKNEIWKKLYSFARIDITVSVCILWCFTSSNCSIHARIFRSDEDKSPKSIWFFNIFFSLVRFPSCLLWCQIACIPKIELNRFIACLCIPFAWTASDCSATFGACNRQNSIPLFSFRYHAHAVSTSIVKRAQVVCFRFFTFFFLHVFFRPSILMTSFVQFFIIHHVDQPKLLHVYNSLNLIEIKRNHSKTQSMLLKWWT